MRELKFRAWKKINTPEMFNDIAYIDFKNRLIGINYRVSFLAHRIDVEDINNVVLMQYTNQKNHKNIEIYEGDYVSKELDNGFDYGEFEGVVELIDGKWVINNRVNHYEELFTEIEQIEILGNIYENSELLKRIETIN